MTNNLEVVRAVYSGLSQRKVAATHRISRNTVAMLIGYAKNQGFLTLADLSGLDESTFSKGLKTSQEGGRDSTYRMPDYEYVHAELAKPHVTLKLLWDEYVQACMQNEEKFYMETQFRRYYHKYARVHKATIRLEHKPALSLEVDWAGTKIGYYDEENEQMTQASLFVSVLPCSQLIYAEPFRDEKMPSWISGHVNAFGYFGAVPKAIVLDNLKSGVTKPNFFDPDLNKTYYEMANYYGTIILPTRVRKPKDKPSVENAVLIASRRIIARLRNTQIMSFADLQKKVRIALEEVNQSMLTGKNESRWTSYIAEEKEYMLSLPQEPYQLADWAKAKVHPDCHISYRKKSYSVPFEYLGEEVDIRATGTTIEIFYHHSRIASHKRLLGKATYSTIAEHMPPDKLFFTDWDKDRFISWAKTIGPATSKVIEGIFDRAVIEQQAYRSCFGVLSLQKKFGNKRLERACVFSLSIQALPGYRQIKSTLEKGLDLPVKQSTSTEKKEDMNKRGFRRGATYFGGNDDVK